MKKWHLVPWVKLEWINEKPFLTWIPHGQSEPLLALSTTVWKDAWIKAGRLFYWEEWLNLAQDKKDVMTIKSAWNYFSNFHLIMNHLHNDIWIFNKKLPALESSRVWKGFSKQVALMKDPNDGWWLEVSGARSSLWSKNLENLTSLLQHQDEATGEKLALMGFDGSGLPRLLTEIIPLQEWLWWESVRFNERAGGIARVQEAKTDAVKLPPTTPMGVQGKLSTLTKRESSRNHDACELLTHQDLVDVLTDVFKVTETLNLKFYGKVERLRGPSGGGVFEHKAYVWVHHMHDLDKGIYLFNGRTCQLEMISITVEKYDQLAKDIPMAWGVPSGQPQAIILVMSDLGKLPQKYVRIALQLAHLNAGLRLGELMQASLEKNLSTCALGGGVLRDLATAWKGDPLLYAPLAELAIAGRLKK